MYDIVYVGSNPKNYRMHKKRYPIMKRASSITDAQGISLTSFVYIMFDGITVDYDFSYKVDEYSQDKAHLFLNGEYYDGLVLLPKTYPVNKREESHRFWINRKEIEIVASKQNPYNKFEVSTYQDYLDAIKYSKTDFFYAVWSDVTPTFDFDYHVPYYDQFTHIFKNGDYYDGICLFYAGETLSQREVDNRFFVKKKEVDIQASVPKVPVYDIVFISYQEPNADENYEKLLKRFPRAQRIHGVKGIHNAHKEAAKLCKTDLFYVVDGDALIMDDFNLDDQVEAWNADGVHVFRSKNPINDLVYGYGGVKLLPRQQVLDMDVNSTDMTTSISNKFKAINQVSNVSAFNTAPFETWKSAFRECAKLSSKTIARQNDAETDERLNIWCSEGADRPYGEYAIAGAKAGTEYGTNNKGNTDALRKINDFDWLKEQFDGNT